MPLIVNCFFTRTKDIYWMNKTVINMAPHGLAPGIFSISQGWFPILAFLSFLKIRSAILCHSTCAKRCPLQSSYFSLSSDMVNRLHFIISNLSDFLNEVFLDPLGQVKSCLLIKFRTPHLAFQCPSSHSEFCRFFVNWK